MTYLNQQSGWPAVDLGLIIVFFVVVFHVTLMIMYVFLGTESLVGIDTTIAHALHYCPVTISGRYSSTPTQFIQSSQDES